MSKEASSLTLSAAERAALAALIREQGEEIVRARMKASRQAFTRAFAGLTVRLGTLALIRSGLATCESDNQQA